MMSGTVTINGEVVQRDQIKSIKSECEPIELDGSWSSSGRHFAPGPFIVTTAILKDGRVLVEEVPNPAHYPPQVQGPPEPPKTPTAEGRERYEPSGYYDGQPCTCTPDCEEPCCGKCGCDACLLSYNDFLDSPAYYS